MQNKYDKAEEYFLKALVGRETMPDYMALIDLYIASGAINKAQELLYVQYLRLVISIYD